MVNIAFRSANSSGSTGTGAVNVLNPSGLTNGDLLIAMMSCGSSGGAGANLTGPAGWTLLGFGGVDASTGNLACWSKIAASEAASWNWTKNGSSISATVSVLAFSNPDPTTPINAGPVFDNGTVASASQVASGVTITRTNSILICGFESNTGGGVAQSYTPPSGMTEATDVQAPNITNWACTDWEVIAGTGATGTRTATASLGTQKFCCMSLAVQGVGVSLGPPIGQIIQN